MFICGKFIRSFSSFLFSAVLLATPALAQSTWPSKPIRLVVPFPAGGTSDALARTVALKMSESLKQTIVIENKPGAASTIGIAEVARAPADGYTLLLAAAPFVTTQYVYPKLPYDGKRDFLPIGLVQTTPLVLVAHPDLKIKTPEDFFKAVKSKSDMTYASSGEGSLPHWVGEMLQQRTGIKISHIPYKGGALALVDVLAGHVNFGIFSPNEAAQQIENGKLVAIASTGSGRSSVFPQLPTLAESGVPDFEVLGWFGIMIRSGTPAPVVTQLSEHFKKALSSADVREKIAQSGDVPQGSVDEFSSLLTREHNRWSAVAKHISIKVN